MNCSICGRFFRFQSGVAWKMIYSSYPPTPDHEIYRCKACVDTHGPFTPQRGIRPEASCGVVNDDKREG